MLARNSVEPKIGVIDAQKKKIVKKKRLVRLDNIEKMKKLGYIVIGKKRESSDLILMEK